MGTVTPNLAIRTPQWWASHERAMSRMKLLEAQTRSLLRTVGPRISAAQDERVGIGYCPKCTPPPEVFKCPACDWETHDQWRLHLHLSLTPQWCQERANRKAKKWAAKT